jgi:hypothetical protein
VLALQFKYYVGKRDRPEEWKCQPNKWLSVKVCKNCHSNARLSTPARFEEVPDLDEVATKSARIHKCQTDKWQKCPVSTQVKNRVNRTSGFSFQISRYASLTIVVGSVWV